jgi:hypothetical protein
MQRFPVKKLWSVAVGENAQALSPAVGFLPVSNEADLEHVR